MNPITKLIDSASLALKRRNIAAEKAKLEAEKKRIEARQIEMQGMEQELRQLHFKRDSIINGQNNIASIAAAEKDRLSKSKAKTDHHIHHRIKTPDCPMIRAWSSRAIEGRRLEKELGDFLDNDVHAIQKQLAEELAAVDKEIEAFENRPID